MVLYLVMCILLINIAICDKANMTETEDEGISKAAHSLSNLFEVANTSEVKINRDCESSECKSIQDIINITKPKVIIQRYNFVLTPPKSYNFLATFPTLAPKKEEKPNDVLEKKVSKHDWPVEYEYELVNPDYELNEHTKKESLLKHSDYESTLAIVKGAELGSLTDHVTPRGGKVIPTKRRASKKGELAFTVVMKLNTKKERIKFQDLGKLYSVPQPSEHPSKYDQTNNPESTSNTITKTNLKVFRSRGFTNNLSAQTVSQIEVPYPPVDNHPNLTNSLRIVTYPVHSTAKPILHKEDMAIPYPYFVVKPDTENQTSSEDLAFGDEYGKRGGPKVRFREIDDFDENTDKFKSKLEVVYHVGDEEENDENYEPMTGVYDSVVITDFSTPAKFEDFSPLFSSQSTSVPKPTTEIENTKMPANPRGTLPYIYPIRNFTFSHQNTVTRNSSTKYPNPYQNGSIYSYYDCLLEINAASQQHHFSRIYVILIFIIKVCNE